MRFLLGVSLFLSTHLIASTTFLSQVHSIETSSNPSEESLVFLKNGRVVKILPQNVSQLDLMANKERSRSWIKVTVNDNREVMSVKSASSPFNKSLDMPLMEQEMFVDDYNPSVLPSLDEAKKVFRDHRTPRDGETQCYNRAQVWTYDWRTQRNLYSTKTWIFFTAKYIRKYNFEWWFHVAPSVRVNIDGQIKERVMDMKYARGPLDTKAWSDIFMKDDALCPTVTTYQDHADYPESGTCFLQKSSMYYYQPVDLEILEKFGTEKRAWVASEVVQAYNEAFGIYP